MKKKLILLITSLVVSLIVAEIVFRAIGKYQTYTERTETGGYVSPYEVGFSSWYRIQPPNGTLKFYNKEFPTLWHFNNEGLPDKTFPIRKKGPRILILGDSFTLGSGTPEDSTYPRQLADIVRDSLSDSVEVWNCGVGGSDVIFEYLLFRDKLLKYKPDMAVVTINNTDIPETSIRGGFERFNKDGTTHYKRAPWFEPLFAHSFLVRRIVFDIFHYNWQLIKSGEEQKVRDVAISELNSAMDSFAILCAKDSIQLLFAFHPMKNELEKQDDYAVQPLIAHCQERAYEYVDAREQFYKMGIDTANAASLYWKMDGHFNTKGYNYLAQSVWTKIPRNGFRTKRN